MSNSPVPQRIVCAANLHRKSDRLILGIRHFDQFMHQQAGLIKRCKPKTGQIYVEQGFIDQKGNFLTRTEAWHVAQAAGQVIRRVGGDTANGGTLYSENLY